MSEPAPRQISIPEALKLAVRLHQDPRRLNEAETLCRRVLDAAPGHPDALHFLGLLAAQQERTEEAIERIQQAIAQAPNHAGMHNNLGNVLKQAGRTAEAVRAYHQAIARQPRFGAAYNNLGTALKDQDNLDGALAAYRQALAIDPQHAGALLNLGSVLARMNRLDEAIEAYRKVIALQPEHAEAYYRLGHIYWRQDRIEDAVDVFRKTTELAPDHGDAFYVLGNLFYQHRHFEDAVAAFRKSRALNPANPAAHRMLGITLNLLDRTDEAIAVWKEWLQQEPDHPFPHHMLASATGRNVPARATNGFVQQTFDAFAETFDEQLQCLAYRAPERIAAAIADEIGSPRGDLDVLDAGCGTGLCGPWLRPYAHHLTGVDLSEGMLGKARGRGGYDRLETAELTAFLTAHHDAYDLVVAADTLVYFGDLIPVFRAVRTALRPRGCWAFTLEQAPEPAGPRGYRLHVLGRYCHTAAYVRASLRETGFTVRACNPEVVRLEAGRPVPGLRVVARPTA